MPHWMVRVEVKWWIVALLGIHSGFAFAQKDTLTLKRVEIVASNFEKDIAGIYLQELLPEDAPLSAGLTLDNWLSTRSNLVLRGFGPASSYGVSIRGSSTSQTQILVNGIPYENPGLATSDVSTLPNAIFSGMSVYRGSAAAYLGNAAIGGSLIMDSFEAETDEIFTQNFGVGSFGSFNGVSKMQYGTQRFSGSTRIYYQKAKNDFLRPDPYNREEEIAQPNALFESYGIAQDLNFYGKGASAGHVFIWAGDTYREIPPIKSKAKSEARQHDKNYRVQGEFETTVKNFDFKLNAALDHGRLNYTDSQTDLDEDSEYSTVHVQGELRRSFDHFQFFALGIFRDSYVLTESYDQAERRFSPAVVGGISSRFWGSKTKASAVFRQEFLNGNALPPVPVFSLDQKLTNFLSLTASAGKAYRLPGLNDLYWIPGGNPDLKPESGWFQELGLNYKPENANLEISATGFNRLIENWIQWVPGQDYWSPRNIKRVRSSGMEVLISAENTWQKVSFKHHCAVTFVESVNLDPAFSGDQSADKQLIYMPKWSLMAQEKISVAKGKYVFNITGRYTGERFTTADNLRILDPYFILDLECYWNLRIKKDQLALFAAVRNILNADYQLQASHYMPGINFQAGIQLKINIKNRKDEI